MNGSITDLARAYDFEEEYDIPKFLKLGPTGSLFKRIFPNETQEIKKPIEEEKGKVVYQEMIKIKIPTMYFIFFSFFLSLSVLLGAFLILSAAKNIILLDPFFLFYGFLGSVCLAVTNLVGILSKKRKQIVTD